jgi:hypothetical protein
VRPLNSRRSASALEPLARAALLTLFLMSAAALARAQCSITGPTSTCGDSISLCGPAGDFEYHWSGPNGFAALSKCISVNATGAYSLRLFDMDNALWVAPCTQNVTAGVAVNCSITGPASACTGSTIQLCGPAGAFTYHWSGPGGFADTALCVTVGVAGAYQLIVTDPASGCASAPCSQTVAFNSCSAPTNCPRPAWFWARACAPTDSSPGLSAAAVASVASCVDARAQIFSWSSETDGFCSTLSPGSRATLRSRARRQFAAVLANVCAGAQGMSNAQGAIGLDPATALKLEHASTTVGAWIGGADQMLQSLEGASLKERHVKDAYRNLIRVGWNINHGRGIGTVCSVVRPDRRHSAEPADVTGSDEAVDAAASDATAPADASEPLLPELADPTGAELSIDFVAPNPFSGQTRIAYSLSSTATQDVMLGVYDLSGRLVRELVHASQAPGSYEVRWDGTRSDGLPARGGVYFVHGHAGSQPIQSRITLLR